MTESSSHIQKLIDTEPERKHMGVLSENEHSLIKEFILLPLMLTLLEAEKERIKAADTLKMGIVYIAQINKVMDMITKDLAIIKKHLRQEGIKIYFENKTAEGLRYMYVYRGYNGVFSMLWSLVKSDMIERLAAYYGVDITSN